MKECKNLCSQRCCEDENYRFGKSPGRCLTCNKKCKTCGYWVRTEKSKCFCCKNKLSLRKNYDDLTIIQKHFRIHCLELVVECIFDILIKPQIIEERKQPTLLPFLQVKELTTK